MAQSALSPRRVLYVIATLLLVNAVLPAQYAAKLAYVPRGVLTFVVGPFAAPLQSLSASLRGDDMDHIDAGPVAETTIQLEMALQQVRQLEDALKEAQQQIALLTQSREIALGGVRLIPARVTGYTGDRLTPTLTIDRGRNKGIYDGAPVVVGFNLVGRIIESYPASADVELINRPGTQLQVRIRPARVEDVPHEVVEMIRLSDDGRTFAVTVKKDERVQVGDLAHLSDPDRWPSEASGYVVGQVTNVEADPMDPLRFKRVTIRPMPPLDALTRVTVLTPVE